MCQTTHDNGSLQPATVRCAVSTRRCRALCPWPCHLPTRTPPWAAKEGRGERSVTGGVRRTRARRTGIFSSHNGRSALRSPRVLVASTTRSRVDVTAASWTGASDSSAAAPAPAPAQAPGEGGGVCVNMNGMHTTSWQQQSRLNDRMKRLNERMPETETETE